MLDYKAQLQCAIEIHTQLKRGKKNKKNCILEIIQLYFYTIAE